VNFIKINNIVFDKDRVLWVTHDGIKKVTVRFEDGENMEFVGDEAVECWRIFDTESDWREPS